MEASKRRYRSEAAMTSLLLSLVLLTYWISPGVEAQSSPIVESIYTGEVITGFYYINETTVMIGDDFDGIFLFDVTDAEHPWVSGRMPNTWCERLIGNPFYTQYVYCDPADGTLQVLDINSLSVVATNNINCTWGLMDTSDTGTMVIMCESNGIYLYNVQNTPLNPSLIASYPNPIPNANTVSFSANDPTLIYVSSDTAPCLYVFKYYSNNHTIGLLGISNESGFRGVMGLVDGYVAGLSYTYGVVVVDARNPNDIVINSTVMCANPAEGTTGAYARGPHLFVDICNYTDTALAAYNMTNPARPQHIISDNEFSYFFYNVYLSPWGTTLIIRGEVFYTTYWVQDWNTPPSLSNYGIIATNADIRGCVTSPFDSDIWFIANSNSVLTLNMTSPYSPTVGYNLNSNIESPLQIRLLNDTYLVVVPDDYVDMLLVDYSDPNNLVAVGYPGDEFVTDFDFSADKQWIYGGMSGSSYYGFFTMPTANIYRSYPQVLELNGTYEIDNLDQGALVRALGNRPYAIVGDRDYTLWVFDVTDPSNPQLAATINSELYFNVAVSPDGMLLFTTGFPDVTVWDMSNVSNITQMQALDVCSGYGDPEDVIMSTLNSTLMWVPCAGALLKVSFLNPANLTILQTWSYQNEFPQYPNYWDLCIHPQEHYALLAQAPYGLSIVNLGWLPNPPVTTGGSTARPSTTGTGILVTSTSDSSSGSQPSQGTSSSDNATGALQGSSSSSPSLPTPVLIGIIMGVLGGCILVLFALTIGVWLRRRRRASEAGEGDEENDKEAVPLAEVSGQEQIKTANVVAKDAYSNLPSEGSNYVAMPRPTPAEGRSSVERERLSAPSTQPGAKHDWEIEFSDIQIHSQLGQGAFGIVFRGTWRFQDVAVKQLLKDKEKGGAAAEDFRKEAEVMMKLRPHRNIVQLMGVCWEPMAIVTEFMNCGSLRDYLIKPTNSIDLRQCVQFAKEIAAGMGHLHKEGIIHRDLAARNVLLTQSREAKIADFGLSRILVTDSNKTKTDTGPLKWMAPEAIRERVYSVKTDVWAFGVTFVEILSRNDPYPNLAGYEVASRVSHFELSITPPPIAPPAIAGLITECGAKDPNERLSFDQIYEVLSSLTLEENKEVPCAREH